MKLELKRNPSVAGATIGKVSKDGAFFCYSLEDQIREIPGRPASEWKVPGRTAIPAGTYRVTLEYSPRFGPDTPTVNGVKGWTGIRIHAGNHHEDSDGCILLGMQATECSLIGGTSRPAVNLLKQELLEATERGETITLTIVNPS